MRVHSFPRCLFALFALCVDSRPRCGYAGVQKIARACISVEGALGFQRGLADIAPRARARPHRLACDFDRSAETFRVVSNLHNRCERSQRRRARGVPTRSDHVAIAPDSAVRRCAASSSTGVGGSSRPVAANVHRACCAHTTCQRPARNIMPRRHREHARSRITFRVVVGSCSAGNGGCWREPTASDESERGRQPRRARRRRVERRLAVGGSCERHSACSGK